MEWICSLALFLVLSGILLEIIADTKYYKFARWVAGVILLLQFIRPLTDAEDSWNRFTASFLSFDYALGADKVLEEIYQADDRMENSVLSGYKTAIAGQIDQLLRKNGLKLRNAELDVQENGEVMQMKVTAEYLDTKEKTLEIWVPTVVPVKLSEEPKKESISPMELYIREVLAEFYQMEENKIEVVIQEAE